MVAFTATNATVLAPLMNLTVADATAVINDVRALPLGAVVELDAGDHEPAVARSAARPDYPVFRTDNEKRRSIVWVGHERGILEAIDARFGVEVWGFVPLNLLPKLRTLLDGQPVGSFAYFVDSSPKISDVKVRRHVAYVPHHRRGTGRDLLSVVRRDAGEHGVGARRQRVGQRRRRSIRCSPTSRTRAGSR